jgi:hypothetical protein
MLHQGGIMVDIHCELTLPFTYGQCTKYTAISNYTATI